MTEIKEKNWIQIGKEKAVQYLWEIPYNAFGLGIQIEKATHPVPINPEALCSFTLGKTDFSIRDSDHFSRFEDFCSKNLVTSDIITDLYREEKEIAAIFGVDLDDPDSDPLYDAEWDRKRDEFVYGCAVGLIVELFGC